MENRVSFETFSGLALSMAKIWGQLGRLDYNKSYFKELDFAVQNLADSIIDLFNIPSEEELVELQYNKESPLKREDIRAILYDLDIEKYTFVADVKKAYEVLSNWKEYFLESTTPEGIIIEV